MAELISRLSRDLVVEILSWVPADSLVESKRVSKSSYTLITELIDDPAFVAQHLNNMKKHSSHSLVFSDWGRETYSLIPVFNTYRFNDPLTFVAEEFDLPLTPRGFSSRLGQWDMVSQCDGILCLLQFPGTIYICNPVLHKCRIVPEFRTSEMLAGIGFGYDSGATDYKLVTLRSCNIGFFQSEVYSFNRDSWKVIKTPVNRKILFDKEEAIFWRGVCYWVIQDPPVIKILCFNVCDEEFYFSSLPENHVPNRVLHEVYVKTCNGSLGLYVQYRDTYLCENPLLVEIFELDGHSAGKDNGGPSWTKRFVVQPLEDFMPMYSFVEDDEILIVNQFDERLTTYNVRSHKQREVFVHDDKYGLFECVCFYRKSLVSVKKAIRLSTRVSERQGETESTAD